MEVAAFFKVGPSTEQHLDEHPSEQSRQPPDTAYEQHVRTFVW